MTMKIKSDKVKSLRENKGWSQQQLAEVCGVNIRTIQRVEKSGTASIETVNALLTVFEISRETIVVAVEQEKTVVAEKKVNFAFWVTIFILMVELSLYFMVVNNAINENKHLSFLGLALYSASNDFVGSYQLPLSYYLNLMALMAFSYIFYKRYYKWAWLAVVWIPGSILINAMSNGVFTPVTLIIAIAIGLFYYFETNKGLKWKAVS